MSKELIHKVNDAHDRLNEGLMQNELLYDATCNRDNAHLNFGASHTTEIIRDVLRQLDGIANELRQGGDA
ncbi:hypothetical protein [Paracoccus saliphilus]|uniref:Uncharacterized protein n=1 Tax=Paracoccus saliphilus TaxID=405559 RepID=A0AA45W4R1_9RHOB|nr:hypothetical protein [Paracoccus saliphilus]WCR04569.1 hypothetical protein JHX88_07580 [Paracoccus saliphilus]SIS86905.1 hypothetical protein SAMN05421772_10725 [Paracoccus saliphilus]